MMSVNFSLVSTKNMLKVVYHHAKFAGLKMFLFVHQPVGVLDSEDGLDFAEKAWEDRTAGFDTSDKRNFTVVQWTHVQPATC